MKKNGQTILLFILLTFGFGNAFGQTLACNDMVQVALDGFGDASIYPEYILEGGPYDYDNMVIHNVNTGAGGDFLLVDCSDIGTIEVVIEDVTTGNKCWSNVIIEDKLAPVAIVDIDVTISMYGGSSVTIPASMIDDGSYDNCAISTMTVSPATFTEEGDYDVLLAVTDQSGNTNVAISNVTVVEGVPTCKDDVSVNLIFGPATAEASEFVEGNATYDVLLVSRDNVDFGETVTFDCDDLGEPQMVYVRIEQDGEEFNCTATANIVKSPAIAVAKQNIEIALSTDSGNGDISAKIYAESIDNGSYDLCTDVKLEIRRDNGICGIPGNDTYNADGHPNDGSSDPSSPDYDSDDGAFVRFCCEDLDNATVDVDGDGVFDAGYVRVWLRVWNDADLDGEFGSAGDSYNETWTYVKVIDPLSPSIVCPADITLTCDADYTDLSITGNATGFGICGEVEVVHTDIIVNINACGEGFARRRFNVKGRADIFCDQVITMEPLDVTVEVSFSQLEDITLDGCPAEIDFGEPTWAAGPCDVLGYTVETDTFFNEPDVCMKLVNNWTVISWCKYNPSDPDWDGSGIWEHTQIVNINGCALEETVWPEDIEIFDENGTQDHIHIDSLQSVYGYAFEEVHPYAALDCGNVYYAYQDQILPISFGYKAIRTWTALDWETNNVIEYNQILTLYTSYNPAISCQALITISLDNGPVTLTPQDVVEGGPFNFDNLELSITDENGDVVPNNMITSAYLGQSLIHTVTDVVTGNSCWGTMNVEGSGTVDELIITASSASVEVGSSVCISLNVENFVDMLAGQGNVMWDPDVISYTGLDNINLPSF